MRAEMITGLFQYTPCELSVRDGVLRYALDGADGPAELKALSGATITRRESGTYYYCLTADTDGNVIEVAAAGKDGDYCARLGAQNQYIRQMVVDGAGYAVKEWTGESARFEPDSEGGVLPNFSTLEFKSSSGDSGYCG